MRFCPFCSAENADDLAVCQSCGRRLPPLPPRRARNAPGTGVLLPPRAATTTQPPPVTAPRRTGTTNPPPVAGTAQPGAGVTSAGLVPVAVPAGGLRAPASPTNPALGAAPGAPPPGLAAQTAPGFAPQGSAAQTAPGFPPPLTGAPLGADDSGRALAQALSPGPAAQRRDPSAPEPTSRSDSSPGRRRSDPPPQPGPGQPRAMPSILRPGSSSSPGMSLPPRALSSQPPATNPALIAAPGAPPPSHTADPPWATSQPRGEPAPSALVPLAPAVLAIEARPRGDAGIEPPPTRIHRPESLVDRPFTPPQVSPVPEIPEPGLINSARYAVRFAKARWQRRGAIKTLGSDIKQDTEALDQVLGALGGVARTAKVDGRVFSGENTAITAAEQRGEQIKREHNDVDVRKLDENSKFADIERERNAKLGEAERTVDEVQKELAQLETQRRTLRDKRKELERRQKAYLKAAEDGDRRSRAQGSGDPAGGPSSPEPGEARQDLRRAAEQNRREAAALEPERQDIDRKVAALERPIGEATAKLDAAKAELDAAKRGLSDAREGHTHRLAELDAEQKRKAREIAQAEAEIARRLVTLGTLVNLNRIEDPQFEELYLRIDRLRGAITARTTEIEKLTAEREAYDRGNLVRGIATLGGAIILFIALIAILRAAIR